MAKQGAEISAVQVLQWDLHDHFSRHVGSLLRLDVPELYSSPSRIIENLRVELSWWR